MPNEVVNGQLVLHPQKPGQGAHCPANTQIGTFTMYGSGSNTLVAAQNAGCSLAILPGVYDACLASVDALIDQGTLNELTGKIFNCETPQDRPEVKARFCFEVEAVPRDAVNVPGGLEFAATRALEDMTGKEVPDQWLKLTCEATVRSNHPNVDVQGIDTDCLLPSQYMWLPDSMTMTFDGKVGGNRNRHFLTNPVVCNQGESFDRNKSFLGDFTGDSFDRPTIDLPPYIRYEVTDCGSLPFGPEISIGLSDRSPGAKPEITTLIEQAYGQSYMKKAKIKFPRDFRVANVGRDVVGRCPQGVDVSERTCIERNSQIGTAEANAPLLESPLQGNVYLLENEDPQHTPYKLAIYLRGFINLKVVGDMKVQDNRVVAIFDNLPHVPISSFRVTLFGGRKGLLINPNICGVKVFDNGFRSFSDDFTRSKVRIPIDQGCHGSDPDQPDPQQPSYYRLYTQPRFSAQRFKIKSGFRVTTSTQSLEPAGQIDRNLSVDRGAEEKAPPKENLVNPLIKPPASPAKPACKDAVAVLSACLPKSDKDTIKDKGTVTMPLGPVSIDTDKPNSVVRINR